jgi:small subunit ribosomal protein S3
VGQKVNPISFRTGVYRNWGARWFSRKTDQYADNFFEDLKIYDFFRTNFPNAEIGDIEIEKTDSALRVILFAARPGVLIGKRGQEMETIRKELGKILNRTSLDISVQEIAIPELQAHLVAKSIAEQIEKRMNYKKVIKRAAAGALMAGAKGVKIRIAGRIGGAEIARDEWLRIGSSPLHTLRSDVDYGFAKAKTTYGIIGVKVWICKGEYKFIKD